MNRRIDSSARAALAALLAYGGAAIAQSPALLPAPPASVCAAPTTATQPGDIHMFPGRWWNPKRNGIGWDFFYNDGQNRMYLTWFTYDQHGRPIWLHGSAADVEFNAVTGERTWQSRLHAARWNRNGLRQLSEVGLVSVTFPNQTTTRAAVSWQWDRPQPGGSPILAVGGSVYSECLLDTYRDPMSTVHKAVPELHQAHSSNWFYASDTEHPLHGWGVDLLVDLHPDGRYLETATAAIFDDADRPTWLQSFDDWGTTPPPGNTLDNTAAGKLRYIRHQPTPGGQHPATFDCEVKRNVNPPDPTDKCVRTVHDVHLVGGTATNYFQREIDTARFGKMRVKADVPQDVVRNSGGPVDAAAIAWPPANNATPFPATIPVMHFDSNHIIVDKSICRVASRTEQCRFKISWIAENSGAEIRRLDLNNGGALSVPLATGEGGQFDQDLNVGDRYQYELSYTPPGFTNTLKLRTPEVRVLLDVDIADQNVEPADCVNGRECDLGAHDPSAGAIAGNAAAEGGAASYTIPITVPPGRAGLQPQLSLSYSSRSGNGVVGLGWSISGLSSIHRCPRTVAQDGKAAPVALNQNDALCLDGQRLVLTGGKGYGEASATYRTEIDTFSRVTQIGGDLTGTATCFKVEEKSGRISHYGGVVAGASCSTPFGLASVNPVGANATLSWQIAKSEDRIVATGGNNIAYRYRTTDAQGNPLGAGELAIHQIHYTGFGSGIGTRQVEFGYEPRVNNDRSSSYLAGGLTEQTQRLKSITASDGAGAATTYTLKYADTLTSAQTSMHSGRSNLQSVEMCATGTDGAACLQPTTVFWNDAPPDHAFRAFDFGSVLPPAITPPANTNEARRIVPIGDVDGDGSRELVVVQHQADNQFHTWLVKYTADRQFQSAVELTVFENEPTISESTPQADIDGDGRSDLVGRATNGKLAFHVWAAARGDSLDGRTQSTLFREIATNIPWNAKDQVVATEDVDGDGHIDIVALKVGNNCLGSANIRDGAPRTLCLFNNKTKRALAANETAYDFDAGVPIRTLQPSVARFQSATDVNGDGISELFIGDLIDPGTQFPIQERLGFLLVSRRAAAPLDTGCVNTGSPLYQECSATTLNLWTAANSVSTGTFDDPGAVPFWTDVNGDGLTDVLFATPYSCVATNTAESMWCIQLATGKGFTNPIKVTGGHEALTLRQRASNVFAYASRLVLHDANSDGKAEVLYPAALAARICQRLEVNYPKNSDNECPIRPATGCNVTPTPGVLDHVGRCHAKVMMCGDDPSGQFPLPTSAEEIDSAICGQYSYDAGDLAGAETSTDFSAYAMKGLRFEQTGANAFRAVAVDVTSGAAANRKVVAQSGRSPAYSTDVFGDGLADLVTTLGCGNRTTSSTPCFAYTDGTNGPAALPDGTPVTSLMPSASDQSSGRKLFVNENLGAVENPGQAPFLPELVRIVKNGMGVTHSWIYAPLSSKAGRPANELPLYEIVPGEATYADPTHFYFQSSMPVVSSLTSTNGVGSLGFRTWRYGYREAMYNHAGRGFQGFRAITKEQLVFAADQPRRLRTTTTFHQKFPLVGRIEKVESGKPRGVRDVSPHTRETYEYRCNVLNRAVCDTVNGAAPTHFPYLLRQATTSFDPAAAEMDQEVAVSSTEVRGYDQAGAGAGWDLFGNQTFLETDAQDLFTDGDGLGRFVDLKRTRQVNVFDTTDVGNWWTGKLTSKVETTFPVAYGTSHRLPADAATPELSVTTAYTWNTNRTPLTIEMQQAAGDDQYSRTVYSYPNQNYGLPSAVEIFAKPTDSQATVARTTRTIYSTDGYFPAQVTQVADGTPQLDQVSYYLYRAKDGQITETQEPTGLRTMNWYDPFGRLVRSSSNNADGMPNRQPMRIAWQKCSNAVCGSIVGAGGKRSDGTAAEQPATYVTTTVQNGTPTKLSWFDALGREIKTASRGFDGTFVATLTEYDTMGTVSRSSVPFYLSSANAAAPSNTAFTYDRAGRATVRRVETKPGVPLLDDQGGNLVTTFTYAGNRTDVAVRGNNIADCSLPHAGGDSRCMRMRRYSGVLGLMRTDDPFGGVTRYWSDAAGKPVAMADANANAAVSNGIVATRRATVATYNPLGHRISSFDPNQGRWNFTYNPFGELKKSTDARGAIATIEQRDTFGRVLAQSHYIPGSGNTVTPGLSRAALRDEWTYDYRGLLQQMRRCTQQVQSGLPPTTCAASSAIWSESYTYDLAARVIAVDSSQLTLGNNRITETTKFHYDANFGREKAIEYPSGLRVQNIFTRFGALRDVLDADTGKRFVGVAAMDAWGNVTRNDYGNGMRADYTWSPVSGQSLTRTWRSAASDTSPIADRIEYAYDSLGNLKSQSRIGAGVGGATATETYQYDAAQRLVGATPDTPNTAAAQYGYDAIGNFTYKSDFSVTASNGYQYSTTPVRGCGPNAAHTVVMRAVPGELPQRSTAYTCDANGNITKSTAASVSDAADPSHRSIDYDVENRPARVRMDATSTDATGYFGYSPDGRRVYELLSEAYVPTTGGIEQFRHQVVIRGQRGYALELLQDTAPTAGWSDRLMRHELGEFSVVLKGVENSNGTGQGRIYDVSYKANDRLGSPLGLMDESGSFTRSGPNNTTVSTKRSFDAFGKAREADFRARPTSNVNPQIGQLNLLPETRDGFTGHEHLDSLALIHMNGRAYDYQLGRFISVDPFVQFPQNSQSLNPYSYVLNNPLSGTDPSGYFTCDANEQCTGTIDEIETIKIYKDGTVTATSKDGKTIEVGTKGDAQSSAVISSFITHNAFVPLNGAQIQGISETASRSPEAVAALLNRVVAQLERTPSPLQGDAIGGGVNMLADTLSFGIATWYGEKVLGMDPEQIKADNEQFEREYGALKYLQYVNPRNAIKKGAEKLEEVVFEGPRRILYHYTNEEAKGEIVKTQKLLPSLKASNPRDARYGDGQYLSDIKPETRTCAQLSTCFLNHSKGDSRFTHYIAIDVTGLEVKQGREHVFVIPNQQALDLTGRIVGHGKN